MPKKKAPGLLSDTPLSPGTKPCRGTGVYQPKNGYAEQNPSDWADAMVNTIKAVMAQSVSGTAEA
mgnify:CR=1 FL=1